MCDFDNRYCNRHSCVGCGNHRRPPAPTPINFAAIDYQAKYNELEVRHRQLRTTIKEALVALYPWYSHGKVGSPMDAVEALKAIDSAVNHG